jgi:sugar phosphate isomerase/epimerase
MRLAAIDYHLRSSDARLCASAKGLGIAALELTRSTLMPDRRWLSLPDGTARWYTAALSLGIAIESLSATFAYEWSPLDRHARPDVTIIDAVADLVNMAAYTGARLVHVPCLDSPAPKVDSDARKIIAHLNPVLEKAHERQIVVALETYWPADAARRLSQFDPTVLQVSLDVGNTVALGRDPAMELEILGENLGQLRLRDRRRHEIFRSLPLGHGDVDWSGIQQQVVKLSRRPQVVLASTGGASLMESHASAQRLLYQLLSEPQFSRVA